MREKRMLISVAHYVAYARCLRTGIHAEARAGSNACARLGLALPFFA